MSRPSCRNLFGAPHVAAAPSAGNGALAAALEEKLLLARYFHQEIQALGFEAGPPPDLSVATFRWAPPGASLEEANQINQQIVDGVKRDGRIFLSSTFLDGRFTLRMAALSFRTHRKTIDLALRILREQVEAAKKQGIAGTAGTTGMNNPGCPLGLCRPFCPLNFQLLRQQHTDQFGIGLAAPCGHLFDHLGDQEAEHPVLPLR